MFTPIPKKGNAKEYWNYFKIVLLHMTTRLYSKSFKLAFSCTWTKNFQMYKLSIQEAEEPEIKLPTLAGSWGNQESSRKTSSASLITLKPLTACITTNYEKFFKRQGYQTTLLFSWETCMHIKKQQLKPDREQWTGSKLGNEYDKAIHCHPAYLTSMQSTSCEIQGWMNHKLETRLPGEITSSDMQMIPL